MLVIVYSSKANHGIILEIVCLILFPASFYCLWTKSNLNCTYPCQVHVLTKLESVGIYCIYNYTIHYIYSIIDLVNIQKRTVLQVSLDFLLSLPTILDLCKALFFYSVFPEMFCFFLYMPHFNLVWVGNRGCRDGGKHACLPNFS